MSDGPHRSLPMRSRWKELAKRASQQTYEASEVSALLPYALANDWNNEVPAAVQKALVQAFSSGGAPSGLPGLGAPTIGELRMLAGTTQMALVVVAYAAQSLAAGRGTPEDLFDVVGRACLERAEAGIRQVEEHLKRRLPDGHHSGDLKSRLVAAVAALDESSLGRDILNRSLPTYRLRRAIGIDEGVAL